MRREGGGLTSTGLTSCPVAARKQRSPQRIPALQSTAFPARGGRCIAPSRNRPQRIIYVQGGGGGGESPVCTCLLTGGRTRHTDIAVDNIGGWGWGNGGSRGEGEAKAAESKISILAQLGIKRQGSFQVSSPPKINTDK